MIDPAPSPAAAALSGAALPTIPRHTVFFVSDGTGITAETFGNSILSQFAIKPRHLRRPFIDTPDKAHQVVREINHTAERDGRKPIVFITLVNTEILSIVKDNALGLGIRFVQDAAGNAGLGSGKGEIGDGESRAVFIVEELNLPPVKIHCSVLAEDAIKAAINDYRVKNGLEQLKFEESLVH